MLKLLRSHDDHYFSIKELCIGKCKCKYEGTFNCKDLHIREYYSISKYNIQYYNLVVSYKDFVHMGLFNYIMHRKNSKKQ